MKINKIKSPKIASVILFVCLCVVYGCESNQDNWDISNDKCVFVEHFISTHGDSIEGDYIEGPMIDSPSYSFYFDNGVGVLTGLINFETNKSLKLVFGRGISYSGLAGSGASTMLFGVYELPNQHENIKIISVDSYGTVHFQYNDSTIILKSKEEWISTTSGIDTQNNNGKIAKANLISTVRLVNYGIIKKTSIKKL